MIQEMAEEELHQQLQDVKGAPLFVYLYTPFCGTCKLAHRLLEITATAIPQARIIASNLNYLPALAQAWKITSVPALVVYGEKGVIAKYYAFHSVDYLYGLIQFHLQHVTTEEQDKQEK